MASFNPKEHMMKLKGKDYLEVKWRLVWFREDHPDFGIHTELIELDDKHAVFKAAITNAEGRHVSGGTGSESVKDFGDFIEKAETKAVGRALAMLGYGTQFDPDLEEGSRIVDAPVEPQEKSDALSVACKTLGIGADVYFQEDATKYAAKPTAPAEKPSAPRKPAPQEPPVNRPFDDSIPKPKAMATPEQIAFITEKTNPDVCAAMLNKFGSNLEKLTYAKAEEAIAKLKGKPANRPRSCSPE